MFESFDWIHLLIELYFTGVLNGILFWFPIEKRLFSFTFLKSIRFYYHYLVLSSLWIFKRFHFKALSFCVAFFFLSLTHLQSISPGMVQTDFLSAYSTSFYAGLPRLKADDVTGAVLYALSTSEHTQVHTFRTNGKDSMRPLTDFNGISLKKLHRKPIRLIFEISYISRLKILP